MNYMKSIFITVCVFALLILSACEKNMFAQTDGLSTVIGTQTPNTDFTPEETIQVAFDYLKAADANEFNQYIYYPVRKEDGVIYAYNIMFGNNLDGESKELVENIMSGFTYEIDDVQESENNAVVTAKITNRNLSNVDLFAYTDANNPLIEAIKNADGKTVTHDIEIVLTNIDGIWKIVMDKELERAICGDLSISPSGIVNEVLSEIFS